MKNLSPKTLPRRLLPRLRRRGQTAGVVRAALLTALLGVEMAGRRARSDVSDLALLAVLGVVLALLAALDPRRFARHRRLLFGRAWGWLRGQAVKLGVDYRGDPPLEQRPLPWTARPLRMAAPLLAATLACLALSPVGLRDAGTRVFYLGYLTLLAALWAVLALGALSSGLLLAAWIHDRFLPRAPRWRRRSRAELALLLGAFWAVVLGAWFLPVWVPVAVALPALALPVAQITGRRELDIPLLWRPARGGGAVHAASWRRVQAQWLALVGVLFALFVAIGAGPPALGLPPRAELAMPLTSFAATAFAWSVGAGLTVAGVTMFVAVRRAQRADPARPRPTRVHVDGPGAGDPAVREPLAARGFELAPLGSAPREADVRVTVSGAPMPALRGRHGRWPLPISATALGAPELLDLLARRDEIQRRRAAMRGFERLFRAAARRRFRAGTGFWLGPQHWFIEGMARDASETAFEDWREDAALSDRVGPTFVDAFPIEARAHLHEVFSTLSIDLLFVEDGVGFRRFRQVLRVLFEHYDVQHRRIDERHLQGLPGVRAVLHDYDLAEPPERGRRGDYPEPEYDEIGRARLLELLRDRGGDGKDDPLSPDRSRRPTPAPALLPL
ncbi:MAG: hypothetical protein AAF682_12550 [Planctomycetota bacterium]